MLSNQQVISAVCPMVVVGLLFYFMFYRSKIARRKALQNDIDNLRIGRKVVTKGGLVGLVSNVFEDQTFDLKMANGIELRVVKEAIINVYDENVDVSAGVAVAA